MKTIDPKNWDSFLDFLREENSVLVLGPQVPSVKDKDGKWVSLPKQLARDLVKILEKESSALLRFAQKLLFYKKVSSMLNHS